MRVALCLSCCLAMGCIVPWTEDGSVPAAEDDTDVEVTAEPEDSPSTPEEPAATIDSSPFDGVGDSDGSGSASYWDGTDPANTCADAVSRPSIGPGVYTGSMAGYTTSGLNANCISFPTRGPDAFHKITVPAGQELVVTFDAEDADSQVYLLRDCSNGSTCLVGNDIAGTDGEESISFTNASATDQTAYLVLGIYQDVAALDSFDLLVEIR